MWWSPAFRPCFFFFFGGGLGGLWSWLCLGFWGVFGFKFFFCFWFGSVFLGFKVLGLFFWALSFVFLVFWFWV